AALDRQLGPVAEHERADPVPLRLVDPPFPLGQAGDGLGEHRRDRSGQHPASIPLDGGTPAGEAGEMEVVLFVPGFFGFGSFGHPDRPLIEYFARVEDALLRAHVRPLRFAVHQPPPAGSLAERVRSLHKKASEVLAQGASTLHLVGHSPGGLDARLLAHPGYAALPARQDLISRIASVVTLSAPFHGTPLAKRAEGSGWIAAPALWFGSILASRRRLRLAGQ